jgi:dihydroflavonol-4-reductase
MTLLITGSTGFVGRNFLLMALASGKYETIWLPVRSVAKLKKQFEEDGFPSLPPSVRVLEGALSEVDLGEASLAHHVVHSAGVIFARSQKEYFETNVDGTLRLFRSLNPKAKIVVLSSLAAAGPSGLIPRSESDTEAPLTWYGKSKLEMEKRLQKDFSDRSYLCLRPPMIFGPRDHATLPLFKMVRKPVHFKPGFKDKVFSVLSVDDLCRAIQAALEGDFKSGMRAYFVAHSQTITDRDILKEAARACSVKSRILVVPQGLLRLVSQVIDTIPTWRTTIPTLSVDRAKEIWPDRWEVSSKAFERDFVWSAKTSFRESVQSSRDWYVRTRQIPAV